MSHPRLTYQELLSQLMNNSRYGALAELFVVDAVIKQADEIAAKPVEQVAAAMRDYFVNGKAWHGVAVEISKKFKELEAQR